jgi:hypothetical protein
MAKDPENPVTPRDQDASAIQKVLPGLSLAKIIDDIGKEVAHKLEMGAHEVGAVLYTGSAFVLYAGQEPMTMDEVREEAKQHEKGGQERERGGMEM